MTQAPTRQQSAAELIAAVVDDGSWRSWDTSPDVSGCSAAYLDTLTRARARSGTDEAVLTGQAQIRGHRVALVVGEFGFLGGSIGTGAAQRIVAAVRRATRERLPLVAATCSGGTRMQEGTSAFVTMIDISRAVVDHKRAGLPYLVYLRHPTTGGVLASWGSLGHVTVAEPGALIGFLGPRVYEALHGRPFAPGVQVAEHLVDQGIIDAVVDPADLADLAARTLALLCPAPTGCRAESTDSTEPPAPAEVVALAAAVDSEPDVWRSIQLTRRPDRPGARELLRHGADDVIALSGTQGGETTGALFTVLTSFGGTSCVLIGQDRRGQVEHGPLGPAALRAARRAMGIAEQLRKPLVCVIDTPGADLSTAAEEGALAGEIARCLADMVELTVPSVAVLLGEGSGGGALALLPARRVIAAQHAWLAPLPPEGASAIVHGDVGHAADLARDQGVSTSDLLRRGIVHAVVPEPVPAHEDPLGFIRAVSVEICRQLQDQTRTAR